MCNLYSMTKSQAAIRDIARAMRDTAGNLPPLAAIFPDTMAPVVRTDRDGIRELTMMRWGFPPPPNLGSRPVTNVRNTRSPYWRAWLKTEFRCLVPATSFCEYTDATPKVTHWFALDETRPPFFFAGIWRPWTGERKKETREHLLYAFLTCEANAAVRPVHAKAMPVILTTQAERDAWMTAPPERGDRAAASAGGRRAANCRARREEGRGGAVMDARVCEPARHSAVFSSPRRVVGRAVFSLRMARSPAPPFTPDRTARVAGGVRRCYQARHSEPNFVAFIGLS